MRQLATYVGLADHSEQILAESFRVIADGHASVADLFHLCRTLADMSDAHRDRLAPIIQRYGEATDGSADEPARLRAAGVAEPREGQLGLLRDLQDLYLLATLVQTTWTVIAQGAQGLRDRELLQVADDCAGETSRQLTWLTTRMKAAAPQALIVTPRA